MIQAIQVIERRRKELGLTVVDLCRIADMHESTYRNMACGRTTNSSFDSIRALTLALNMTLDDLVSLMNDDASPKVAEALQNINKTPATTRELDVGLNILARMMENAELSHKADMEALRQQHKADLADLADRYNRLIASKDAQFGEERAQLLSAVAAKDRWIKYIFCTMTLIVLVACILLGINI